MDNQLQKLGEGLEEYIIYAGPHPLFGGSQMVLVFSNGYTVSLVRAYMDYPDLPKLGLSYGFDRGDVEILIKGEGDIDVVTASSISECIEIINEVKNRKGVKRDDHTEGSQSLIEPRTES